MALLFFNGPWTMFCRGSIVRMYILMIFFLVPLVIRRSHYWLTTTAICVPWWLDYGGRSWLLRLLKLISLYVRLIFVALCWKTAHVGQRQGNCWRLSVGTKPRNVRDLRGFLELANSYSGYVPNYASIATPLINMLKD